MKANRGLCVWFTGRPCSGKTTIAVRVRRAIEATGKAVTLLDGDEIRPILCPDLGFSEGDRLKNLQRVAFVAREVVRHGGIVLVATVSPYASHRAQVRSSFEAEEFIQVFAAASLRECEHRDVKGMYARARRGELPGFTGVASPYEEPADSEIQCDTERERLQQCVTRVVTAIAKRVGLSLEAKAHVA